MNKLISEKRIHKVFIISVMLKALNAVIEIIGGVFVYFISQENIIKAVFFFTQEELTNDPNDVVANYLINTATHFSLSAKHFIAFYLFSYGIIKLGVIIGLLKNKLWAYPSSIVIFGLFIFYQMYRYFYTHSLWLIIITIFDIFVIWLIWLEYKNKKNLTAY